MNDSSSCGSTPASSPTSSVSSLSSSCSSRSSLSSVSSRCSSRSRETTPTLEDENFIVDDGYRYDEDPDYVPPNERFILTGDKFTKLTKRAKKLGAESLDYSTRKNNKYMATLPGGKKVHFGSPKYADYLIHKDKERRDKYLARATKIKNKQGELTYTNPESSNYWSVNLLWPKN